MVEIIDKDIKIAIIDHVNMSKGITKSMNIRKNWNIWKRLTWDFKIKNVIFENKNKLDGINT